MNDFTKGSLPRQMLILSLPFALSNFAQVLASVAEMIVTGGAAGGAGLSAVATSGQVVMFMTLICIGFSMGGQVMVSQLVGAGKREELNKTIGTLFSITAAMGLLMTLAGLLFCKAILRLLKTPDISFQMAADYLFISSAGMLFFYGGNMVLSVLRGMGNSKQPCIFIFASCITSIFLVFLFSVKSGLGVAGVAFAAVIGQGVSFFWSVLYLRRNRSEFGFDFKPRSFIPEKKAAAALLKLGIPFALRSASVNISMMFVTALVNSAGVAASAVFGIGQRLNDAADKISLAVNYSVSTVAGQNFAARNFERSKKSVYWGWFYSFAVYIAFAAVFLTNTSGLFRIFTREQDVLALAPAFAYAVVWGFPAIALTRGTNGFIQGVGNSVLILIFSLFDGFILRIGLCRFLGVTLGMGLYGIFLGYGLAAYGTAVPGVIYVFCGFWKKRETSI